MSHGFVSLGPAEWICLAVFGLIVLGAAATLAYLLTKNAGGLSLANVVEQQKPAAPSSSHMAVLAEGVSHADVVAKIARRFCPKCRAVLTGDAPEGLCPACLMAGGLSGDGDGHGSNDAAGNAPAADIAALQSQLPKLEILELLGQGGMGAVYKARQRSLNRIVALKIIRPDNAADPSFGSRFEREAQALAQLNHPNIVTVHDFGHEGELYYLIMEYVDGVNLRQTMRAGRLSPQEALAIVPQICDALQFAHDHGIVHRDIKPENVLLDRHGRVKIADFGLAKLLGINSPDSVALTVTQHAVGTPRYMAPEQLDHPTAVDHRADIYSLGVVIYEMLTGELPVGHFPLPSERVQVDVRIDEVVLRALAKEPEKRFQKASQVKSGLASASSWPSPLPKPIAVTAQLVPERREVVRRLIRGPSAGLIASGMLGVVASLILVAAFMTGLPRGLAGRHSLPIARPASAICPFVPCLTQGPLLLLVLGQSVEIARYDQPTWVFLSVGVVVLISLVPSFLMIAGGWQMWRLESYGLAMIAAIVALIPCSLGWLLGLPMGIWALAILSRRDVRDAFGS
jgi:tRNA A-37 threonylcarbamoyl transferase component Bud32